MVVLQAKVCRMVVSRKHRLSVKIGKFLNGEAEGAGAVAALTVIVFFALAVLGFFTYAVGSKGWVGVSAFLNDTDKTALSDRKTVSQKSSYAKFVQE